MRAIWYDTQGPAEDVLTLGEVEAPEPGPGEVAVWMHASGVNPSDVKTRSGKRGPMAVKRQIPHSDGAGVIKRAGAGVDPARIGERVWIHNAAFRREGGTCAEICVVPAEWVHALPDNISFEQGACLGIPAMTAHRALFCDGSVKGKAVLVTGGAGAVGEMAIQLARWAGAAKIIATVSGPEKAEIALAAGADEIVNYRQQDVAEAVRAATGGDGVDLIVEVEFGANLEASARALKPHGTIASYASEGERNPSLPFYDLMFLNARIQTVFMYTLTEPQRAAAVHDINAALSSGALTPRVAGVWELEDTATAHAAVEAGDMIGTVVVRV